MTALDFARFGLLYLRGGEWDGTQIVPEEWVDYARLPVPDDASVRRPLVARRHRGPLPVGVRRRTGSTARRSRSCPSSTSSSSSSPTSRARARPRRRPRHRSVRRRLSLTARRRDTPMHWPIAPMKAVTAEVVPIGDVWMYEPKWDGHRVLVRRIGDDVDAVSSTGKPKLPQWPWLATAVAAATDHDVVLDGEVVAYDDEGRHTFQSVGRADRDHAFVVFDLLALDGDDLRDRPWSERRELLEASVRPMLTADDHAGERRRRRDGGGDAGAALRGHRRQADRLDVPVRAAGPGVGEGQVHQRPGDGRRRLQARRGQSAGSVRVAARRRPRRRRRPAVRQRRRHRVQRADAHDADGQAAPSGDGRVPVRPCRRSCRAAPTAGCAPSSSPRSGSSSGPRAVASGRRCSSASATTNPRSESRSARRDTPSLAPIRRTCGRGSCAPWAPPRRRRRTAAAAACFVDRVDFFAVARRRRRVALLGCPSLGEAGLEGGGEVDDGGPRRRLGLEHRGPPGRLLLDDPLDAGAVLVGVLLGLEVVAQRLDEALRHLQLLVGDLDVVELGELLDELPARRARRGTRASTA